MPVPLFQKAVEELGEFGAAFGVRGVGVNANFFEGGKVCGAFAVVDRDEGGRVALEREGIAVVALARITDIVSRMA